MDIGTTLLIVCVLWLLIYAIAHIIGVERLREKGVEASTPFFLLWKTERLNAFLTKMGKKFPRVFFNVGIIVGFGGMIYAFYMFGENLIKFFIQPEEAGGVVPIIPGVTITGMPLVYMLVALAVTLLTHEFAHGLSSSKDNIPIKSSGLLFFLVLFGGFVEPDEEVFEKEASAKDRMRLLAAGSFSNLIWAFIILLIMSNFTSLMSIGFNPPSGAYIYDIATGTPASGTLQIGDVIVGLNETTIETWNDVSLYMTDTESGALLMVSTLDSTTPINVTLAASEVNASKGYIGIYGADYWEPKAGWDLMLTPMYAFHMQQILVWCFIILASVALFNLMPIPMLDGDKLLSNGLSLIIKDETKIRYIMWPARIAAIVIILLSISLSLLMGKGLF